MENNIFLIESPCGTIAHQVKNENVPRGWIFCFIDESDVSYHQTRCKDLIKNSVTTSGTFEDYRELLSAGGAFGCSRGGRGITNHLISGSCKENYQINTAMVHGQHKGKILGLCIKFPNGNIYIRYSETIQKIY